MELITAAEGNRELHRRARFNDIWWMGKQFNLPLGRDEKIRHTIVCWAMHGAEWVLFFRRSSTNPFQWLLSIIYQEREGWIKNNWLLFLHGSTIAFRCRRADRERKNVRFHAGKSHTSRKSWIVLAETPSQRRKGSVSRHIRAPGWN